MDEQGTPVGGAPEPGRTSPSPPPPPPPPPTTQLQPYAAPAPAPAPANGFAVASLVLGIVGVIGTLFWLGVVGDILAIVFGVIGRNRAKEGAPNGGMATAGLVLGIIGLVLFVVFVIAVVSVINSGTYAPVG